MSVSDQIKKFFHNDSEDVTEEEIISMVSEGSESGELLSTEAEMVQNVLNLDKKCAKDIMVHRGDIEALEDDTTLSEAIAFFQENHYSRVPVYHESLDNILGIIHIKEILFFSTRPEFLDKKITEIEGLMFPAETVPETHGIHTLFSTMKREKLHMVIVVDEYGQTSGLVSMEDIIEEIVGNILDEHDEEESAVLEVFPDEYRMDGKTPLSEVSEKLGTDFTSEEFETLNGILTDAIGRVPQEHESFTVTLEGYEFHVLDVRERIIREVEVKRIVDAK